MIYRADRRRKCSNNLLPRRDVLTVEVIAPRLIRKVNIFLARNAFENSLYGCRIKSMLQNVTLITDRQELPLFRH